MTVLGPTLDHFDRRRIWRGWHLGHSSPPVADAWHSPETTQLQASTTPDGRRRTAPVVPAPPLSRGHTNWFPDAVCGGSGKSSSSASPIQHLTATSARAMPCLLRCAPGANGTQHPQDLPSDVSVRLDGKSASTGTTRRAAARRRGARPRTRPGLRGARRARRARTRPEGRTAGAGTGGRAGTGGEGAGVGRRRRAPTGSHSMHAVRSGSRPRSFLGVQAGAVAGSPPGRTCKCVSVRMRVDAGGSGRLDAART